MKLAIVVAVCLCAVALVQARGRPGRRGNGGQPGRVTGQPGGGRGQLGGRRGRNPVIELAGLCKALELDNTEEIPAEWDEMLGDFEEDICVPLFAVLAEIKGDGDSDGDDNAFGCAGRRGPGGRGGGRRGPGRRGAEASADNADDDDNDCPPINVQEELVSACDALDNMPTAAPPNGSQDVFNVLLGMGEICDQVDLLTTA